MPLAASGGDKMPNPAMHVNDFPLEERDVFPRQSEFSHGEVVRAHLYRARAAALRIT
jgi:hypothetical protein